MDESKIIKIEYEKIKLEHEIKLDDNKLRIEINNNEIIFSLIVGLSFIKYLKRFKHEEFRNKYKISKEKDLKEIYNDLINDEHEINEKEKKIILGNGEEIILEEKIRLTNEEMIKELIIEIKNIKKEKDELEKQVYELDNIVNNYKNEINLIYNLNEEGECQIFGDKFVNKNKNNIELNINGTKSKLVSKYKLKKGDNNINMIVKNKIKDLCDMFKSCKNLKNIEELKYLNIKNCSNFKDMFYGCSLKDIKPLENWNISNKINLESLLNGCHIIKNINLINNIKSKYILEKLFENLKENKLLKIIQYNKNIQNRINKSINYYKNYYNQIEIEIIPINIYDKNYFINIPENDKNYYHIYFNDSKEEAKNNYFAKNEKVDKIKIIINNEIKSFEGLFSRCKCIKSLNFIKFNRKDITNMSSMFYKCSSLKELNLSNFNTNNVIDMRGMFNGCSSLKKLNLNKFKTDNVTNMEYMFSVCKSLKKLNLSNFNTNNVTDMSGMFSGCQSLNELNLNYINTDNVTNMRFMFYDCCSLDELDLSNFNTNNVTDMMSMFENCSSLNYLNISNFKTDNVTNMSLMFCCCSSLFEIVLNNFNTNRLTNMWGMLYHCSNELNNKITNLNNNIDDLAYSLCDEYDFYDDSD